VRDRAVCLDQHELRPRVLCLPARARHVRAREQQQPGGEATSEVALRAQGTAVTV
jgi:hypothetical protein